MACRLIFENNRTIIVKKFIKNLTTAHNVGYNEYCG